MASDMSTAGMATGVELATLVGEFAQLAALNAQAARSALAGLRAAIAEAIAEGDGQREAAAAAAPAGPQVASAKGDCQREASTAVAPAGPRPASAEGDGQREAAAAPAPAGQHSACSAHTPHPWAGCTSESTSSSSGAGGSSSSSSSSSSAAPLASERQAARSGDPPGAPPASEQRDARSRSPRRRPVVSIEGDPSGGTLGMLDSARCGPSDDSSVPRGGGAAQEADAPGGEREEEDSDSSDVIPGPALSGDPQDTPEVAMIPSKRPRHSTGASTTTFKLRGNRSDAPAANPPLFAHHALREEQRRSLGWMLRQESRRKGFLGGLLADKMGYGKTATTIGLLSLDPCTRGEEPPASRQEVSETGFLPSNASLVLCPPHLFDQWTAEFRKFLGDETVETWEPVTPEATGRPAQGRRELTLEIPLQRSSDTDYGFTFEPLLGAHCRELLSIEGIAKRANQKLNQHNRIQPGDFIQRLTVVFHPSQYFEEQYPTFEHAPHSSIGFPFGPLGFGGPLAGQAAGAFGFGMPRTVRVMRTRQVTSREVSEPLKFFTSSAYRAEQHFPPNSTLKIVFLRSRDPGARLEKKSGSGPIKLLLLKEWQQLRRVKLGDVLSGFGVVLVSTRMLASESYRSEQSRVLSAFCQNTGRQYNARTNKLVAMLRKLVDYWKEDPRNLNKAKRAHAPILEAILWRRVVLDEFHETADWAFNVKERVKGLGSRFRWGLSGTPPLADVPQIAAVASLLQYAAKEDSQVMQEAIDTLALQERWKARQEWEGNAEKQEQTVLECQRFLDTCVRQNASEVVEAIRCVQHEEAVALTPEEKLIYRQACHDQGIFDLESGYEGVDLQCRAALLQRCAHFSLATEAADAWDAVQQLGAAKTARIQALQKQLALEATRAESLKAWTLAKLALWDHRTSLHHVEAKSFLEGLVDDNVERPPAAEALKLNLEFYDQHGMLRVRPEVQLEQPVSDSEVYPDGRHRHAVLHAVAKKVKNRDADAALSELGLCEMVCSHHHRRHLLEALDAGLSRLADLLDQAYRSRDFFKAQLTALSGTGLADFQCAICLGSDNTLENLCIIPCGHIFHRDCLMQSLSERQACPYCAQTVARKQARSIIMELQPPTLPPPSGAAGSSDDTTSPQLRAHGSKLNALALRLRSIHAEDEKAKVIVFTQWSSLRVRVEQALTSHGIESLLLPRGVKAGAALRKFQEDDSGPRVILLSLDEVASGANLTSANHVVFLHPMNAVDMPTAVAYEAQAIGRVRRIGQEKDVHIWRFVARETVEEHIHRLHREHAVSTSA